MARYLTDGNGDTFSLTEEGRAAYPLGVRNLPSKHRTATPVERAGFKKRRSAVWAVVQRFLPMCYKLVPPHLDRDEVVHEAGIPCVLDCLRCHDPTGKAGFGTYLYAALRRRYVGWLRSPRRAVAEQKYERAAAPEPEVDDTVQYILERLDEYDRGLLVLKYWEGLTLVEIADAVGCSKATISVDLQHALRKARNVRRTS